MKSWSGFSNARSARLSPAEREAQMALLAPLRHEHTKQLFESGLVARAVGSTALSNVDTSHSKLNEGTLAHPFRWALWNMNRLYLAPLLEDIAGSDTVNLQQQVSDRTDPSYELCILRSEPQWVGKPNTYEYVVGAELSVATADELGIDRLQPVQGFLAKDVALVAKQLAEVQQLRQALNLTVIDEYTLVEGFGELFIPR